MKTLHTWQCPSHGVLHTMTCEDGSSTETNATAIASSAVTDVYAKGCPEVVARRSPDGRVVREPCGEHVTHMAGSP